MVADQVPRQQPDQPQPPMRARAVASALAPVSSRPVANEARERLAVYAIIALVALWIFSYSYAHAPLIPMADGWTWIAHAKGYHDGGLAGLWREHPLVHAQHLYLLPSLVAFVVGPWVDYSYRPFAFLSVALLVACGITLYRVARRLGLRRWEALVVFLAVASIRHYENLLFGFQIGFPLCVVLGSWAVLVADARRDGRGLCAAFGLALGSTASSSAGIVACIVVACVRWVDPLRAQKWLVLAIAAAALFLAIHWTLTAMYDWSFVADALSGITWSTWSRVFLDALLLLGGGVTGGAAGTPVGLGLFVGVCLVVGARVRETRRIDGLSGLALLSLLMVLAVAVARSPLEETCSRHAIFAAPAVGVVAIWLVRLSRTWSVPAAACSVVFAIASIWLYADAHVDALHYLDIVRAQEIDERLDLARTQPLGPEEEEQFNPHDAHMVQRRLMAFTLERRLSIFSPRYDGIEIHAELPALATGEAQGVVDEAGVLQFAGAGYVYDKYVCRFESGCTARLSVDVSVQGQATIGFIIRDVNGVERDNVGYWLPPAKPDFRVHSFKAEAKQGETLDAYVFAPDAQTVVRIRSFTTVVARGGW
jgi:hypothetical protein